VPASVRIPVECLKTLIEAAIGASPVIVYTGDSDPGEETQRFHSAAEVWDHFSASMSAGARFVGYALHYTNTGGYVENRRVALNPVKCKGHTFRYSVSGWGVIHLQIQVSDTATVNCTVSVNSRRRAEAWSGTYPGLKSPDLWSWPLVERHSRRLTRQLKRAAQPGVAADGAAPRS
jgi:hypothetical protein